MSYLYVAKYTEFEHYCCINFFTSNHHSPVHGAGAGAGAGGESEKIPANRSKACTINLTEN